MADLAILAHFASLLDDGWDPSVGAWAQVDLANDLTTRLNAFNTLGTQALEIYLFDPNGDQVGTTWVGSIDTNQTLRLDLAGLAGGPFEGSVWVWSKGDTDEGSIGLQAIDLDFINLGDPEYTLGTNHLMFDFFDTLGAFFRSLGESDPYVDLVSPRLLVDESDGGPLYDNYLGIAHIPLRGDTGAQLEITVTNDDGDSQSKTVSIPTLGARFDHLESLFPGLPQFLMRDGETRGYGAVSVRALSDDVGGLCGMVKVQLRPQDGRGMMMVGHLNDRYFARPAMKVQD